MASLGTIERLRCIDPACGHNFEQWVKAGDELPDCPECGKHSVPSRIFETRKHAGMDYDQPVYSDSMGVSPDQVQEHRRIHPEIPITDDGRVVVRNHYEYKKIRKKLGMVDRDRRYI